MGQSVQVYMPVKMFFSYHPILGLVYYSEDLLPKIKSRRERRGQCRK